MLARVLGILILLIATSAAVYFLWQATHDTYRFASEEARTSLEVTEAQSAELKGAAIKSDAIAFGIMGAAFAAVIGFAANPKTTIGKRVVGGLTGVVLGAIGGAIAGYIGHWHDVKYLYPSDPVFYWLGRWAMMIGPIAVAAGIAVSASGNPAKLLKDSLVATIIGGGLVVVFYCFMTGSITPIESHERVFPAFSQNRILLLALMPIMGILAFIVLVRTEKHRSSKSTDINAEATE